MSPRPYDARRSRRRSIVSADVLRHRAGLSRHSAAPPPRRAPRPRSASSAPWRCASPLRVIRTTSLSFESNRCRFSTHRCRRRGRPSCLRASRASAPTLLTVVGAEGHDDVLAAPRCLHHVLGRLELERARLLALRALPGASAVDSRLRLPTRTRSASARQLSRSRLRQSGLDHDSYGHGTARLLRARHRPRRACLPRARRPYGQAVADEPDGVEGSRVPPAETSTRRRRVGRRETLEAAEDPRAPTSGEPVSLPRIALFRPINSTPRRVGSRRSCVAGYAPCGGSWRRRNRA